jgi:WD40 repeat protein
MGRVRSESGEPEVRDDGPNLPTAGDDSEPALPASSDEVAATVPDPRSGPDGLELGDQVTREHEGRYEIRRRLAAGGQSRVFIAHDRHLGRDIALKQPRARPGSPAGDDALARFLREARITAGLEHPNIVPIHEIGQRTDGTYYCAQKLIRAHADSDVPRTLCEALAEARDLSERLALLPHFLDVCNAIAFAHDRGVIHRDLKPDNIVIGSFGETVILDWGLAKRREARENDSTVPGEISPPAATQLGQAFGTPSYMSPEQARGQLDIMDERTDIWSLGAILYEILTGAPPFVGESALAIIDAVLRDPITPVRRRCPEAPAALAAVAETALEADPDDRYDGADELAAEIAAYQDGARVTAYDYSLLELIRLFLARHRAAAAVAAVAACLLAVAAGLVWRNYLRAQRYLGAAETNLAHAFVEKARDAERSFMWDRAAAYYAAARAHADLPEARWGARLAANRADAELVRIGEQGGEITVVQLAPNGRLLASSSTDGSVVLWDLERRSRAGEIAAASALFDVAFSPDGQELATAGEDGAVELWSISDRTLRRRLASHGSPIHNVSYSPDGHLVAAGTGDYHLLLFNLESGQQVADVAFERNPVYSVSFSPDGALLAVAGWSGEMILLDGRTGEEVRRFRAHDDAILAAGFSPDGTLLATGGRDGLVKLWSVGDGALVRRLAGHRQKVFSLAFSPDGTLLATGSTDKSIRSWHVSSGRLVVGSSYGHDHAISSLTFTADGAALLWASGGQIWKRPVGSARELEAAVIPIVGIAISADGSRIAHPVGRAVRILDGSTLAPIATLPRLAAYTSESALSPDGRLIAAYCDNSIMCLVNVEDGTEVARLAAPRHGPAEIEFSRDGRLLACGSNNGEIIVWEVSSEREAHRLSFDESGVFAVAFSPDGVTLAAGGYRGSIALWDLRSGARVATLTGHSHGVRRVTFSPDGTQLASASWDRTVRLWDVRAGAEAGVLRGHDDYAFDLAYFPGGRQLVSGSWDGTLRLWDVATGDVLASFVSDEQRVYSVAVAGPRIVYAGYLFHALELSEPGPAPAALQRQLESAGLELDGVRLRRANPR